MNCAEEWGRCLEGIKFVSKSTEINLLKNSTKNSKSTKITVKNLQKSIRSLQSSNKSLQKVKLKFHKMFLKIYKNSIKSLQTLKIVQNLFFKV